MVNFDWIRLKLVAFYFFFVEKVDCFRVSDDENLEWLNMMVLTSHYSIKKSLGNQDFGKLKSSLGTLNIIRDYFVYRNCS